VRLSVMERRMKFAKATKFHRKSGEGSMPNGVRFLWWAHQNLNLEPKRGYQNVPLQAKTISLPDQMPVLCDFCEID
jgi:hypothetical protein